MDLLFLLAFCVLVIQSLAFLLSIYFKRNDIADIFWGLGISFLAVAAGFWTNFLFPITYFVVFFTCIWGLRLSLHILLRIQKTEGEDIRYKTMSEKWKFFYLRSYFQVFVLQGSLMIPMSASVIALSLSPPSEDLNYVAIWLGVLIWFFGFTVEALSDYQLDKFLEKKKKGEIMDKGLWKYSRHPNYFGEVVLWWGIWIMTFGTPYFWYAIITPLTISVLILGISGIPMQEKRKKNDLVYQDYASRTSIFVPWFPKKKQQPFFEIIHRAYLSFLQEI
jgi:steroid 5-alpha reductase family enzyme